MTLEEWYLYMTTPGEIQQPVSIADEIKNWLKEFAEWAKALPIVGDIIKVLGYIKDLLNKFLDLINDAWNVLGRVFNAGQKGQSKIDVDVAQAKQDAKADEKLNTETAKVLGSTQPPSVADQRLCAKIVMHQAVPIMYQFGNLVSRLVVDGMALANRCPTCDVITNPADVRKSRCGKLNEGDPKTASALDGYPQECLESGSSTNIEAPGFGVADSDVNAGNLYDWESVYELPEFSTESVSTLIGSVKVSIANPQNDAQQMWVAARNFCAMAAGPRPAPAVGKHMNDGDNTAGRAKYISCLSKQNEFNRACGELLKYETRPHCSSTGGSGDLDGFCETPIAACENAVSHGLVLPASFGGCSHAMTLYQSEYIAVKGCTSVGDAEGAKMQGVSDSDVLEEITDCEKLNAKWQKKLETVHHAFILAIEGIDDMEGCWDGAERKVNPRISGDAGEKAADPLSAVAAAKAKAVDDKRAQAEQTRLFLAQRAKLLKQAHKLAAKWEKETSLGKAQPFESKAP